MHWAKATSASEGLKVFYRGKGFLNNSIVTVTLGIELKETLAFTLILRDSQPHAFYLCANILQFMNTHVDHLYKYLIDELYVHIINIEIDQRVRLIYVFPYCIYLWRRHRSHCTCHYIAYIYISLM